MFNKNNYLLDIYAKAVSGQRIWGVRNKDGVSYKARVVKEDFDWMDSNQLLIPMEDLIIYEMHVRGFTQHGSSRVEYPGNIFRASGKDRIFERFRRECCGIDANL